MRTLAQSIAGSALFQNFIISVIVLNAVFLGLETMPDWFGDYYNLLSVVDTLFLSVFVVELAIKIYAYRLNFFKNGWNLFDFAIVGVSILPFFEGLSVLRSLRILRVLRLISVVPQFRKITQAFFDSLAGLSVIGAIIGLIFYIAAVMSTNLFGAAFPEWFGTIGRSLFTLFQIMTLESWSMGIVRPLMDTYPYAWLFFIPFILVTTFAALNLLIGVIVNSMQTLHDDTTSNIDQHLTMQDEERSELKARIASMEAMLADLRSRL